MAGINFEQKLQKVIGTLQADVPDFQYVYPTIQRSIAMWILEDRNAEVTD